jgi:hypothetical protein
MKSVELRGIMALIAGNCVGRMMNRVDNRAILEPDEAFDRILASLRCMFPAGTELNVEEKAGRKYEELRSRDEGLPTMGF